MEKVIPRAVVSAIRMAVVGLWAAMMLIYPIAAKAEWQSGFCYPGVRGSVFANIIDSSGNLYVGGYFDARYTGISSSHIAKWDGAKWSGLG